MIVPAPCAAEATAAAARPWTARTRAGRLFCRDGIPRWRRRWDASWGASGAVRKRGTQGERPCSSLGLTKGVGIGSGFARADPPAAVAAARLRDPLLLIDDRAVSEHWMRNQSSRVPGIGA